MPLNATAVRLGYRSPGIGVAYKMVPVQPTLQGHCEKQTTSVKACGRLAHKPCAPPLACCHTLTQVHSHPRTCHICDQEAAIRPQEQPVLKGLAFLHGFGAAGFCWHRSTAPLPGAVRLQGLAQVFLQGSVGDIVCRPVDQVQRDDPKQFHQQ